MTASFPSARRFFILLQFLLFQISLDAQWTQINLPSMANVPFLSNFIAYQDKVYANGGGLVTTDQGSHWTHFGTFRLFDIHPTNGHMVAITPGNQLIYSTDSGQNWQLMGDSTLVNDLPNVAIGRLQISGENADVIIGVSSNRLCKWIPDLGWDEIFVQPDILFFTGMEVDNDDIWLASNKYFYHYHLPNQTATEIVFPSIEEGWASNSLLVRKDTVITTYTNNVSGQRFNVAISYDRGQNWLIDSTTFNNATPQVSLDLMPGNGPFLLNAGTGVFLFNNTTESWERLFEQRVYDAFFSGTTMKFPAPQGGLEQFDGNTITNYPTFWEPTLPTFPVKHLPRFIGQTLVCGQNGAEMAYSSDFGNSWNVSRHPWPFVEVVKSGSRYAGMSDFYLFSAPTNSTFEWQRNTNVGVYYGKNMDVVDNTVYTLSANKVYKSTDNGLNWLPSGFNNWPISGEQVQVDFAVDTGKMYLIGPWAVGLPEPGGIRVSNDEGQTWNLLPGYEMEAIHMFRLFSINGHIFFLDQQNSTFSRSDDGGLTFTPVPLPDTSGMTIFRLRFNNDQLFIYFGNDRLFWSADLGAHWLPVPPKFPGFFEDGMDFTKNYSITAADSIVVCTHKTLGVFRYDLRTVHQAHGYAYLDLNSNGIKDTDEKGIEGALIRANNSDTYTQTDAQGIFFAYPAKTGDTLTLVTPYEHFQVNPAFILVASGDTATAIFALQPIANVTDNQIVVAQSTVFNRGFENKINIQLNNRGSQISSGTIRAVLPPAISLLNALPAIDQIDEDTLVWNFSGLHPFEQLNYQLTVQTGLVELGTPVSVFFEARNGVDANPEDNFWAITDSVVGSYDPNDKVVVPSTFLPELAKKGTPLFYTIRFQNTGNYPTQFVVLRDTLEEGLDLHSIQLVSSSHPCRWQIEKDRVLTVYFTPLSLAASSVNEPASHGYVQFAIQLSKDLELNQSVQNRAAIYFDYNEPIITLDAVCTVRKPSISYSDTPTYVIVQNPAHDQLKVQWLSAPASGITLQLFDASGRLCAEKNVVPEDAVQSVLDVAALPGGVYWLRFSTDQSPGSARKVVIQH